MLFVNTGFGWYRQNIAVIIDSAGICVCFADLFIYLRFLGTFGWPQFIGSFIKIMVIQL